MKTLKYSSLTVPLPLTNIKTMIDNPWQNRYSTMCNYLKKMSDSELESVINFVGLYNECKGKIKSLIIDKIARHVVWEFKYEKYIILQEYKTAE